MRTEWGSVDFFKRLIRFALFYLLPGLFVALVGMVVLYIVQASALGARVHALEARIATLESQASAPAATSTPAPVSTLAPTPTRSPGAAASPAATSAPSAAPLTFLPAFRQDPVPTSPPAEKVAYLTFDDGPSARTLEVLDILDRYGLHAAFFVLNHSDAASAGILRETVRRGNVVGMHSATHAYERIYASVESFVSDLDSNYDYILRTTGVAPRMFRFAGGSNSVHAKSNGPAIRREMALRGFAYYDWNCACGDGNAANDDPAVLVANVLATAKGKDRVIVLCHDSYNRAATVAALPSIIEGLEAQGFRFGLLTPDVPPIQFHSP